MFAGLKIFLTGAWQFLSRYGALIGTVLIVLLGLIVFRRVPGNPSTEINKALDKVKYENELKRLEIIKGKAAAVAAVERKYAETLKAMDDKQREEAAKLRTDPIALSRRLLAASNR